MPFQPTNVPALFDGAITNVSVVSSFPDSQLIVATKDNWSINVDWNTSGFLAPAIGGNWEVRAFLESMGIGFEDQVGPTVNVAAAGPLSKNATIPVAPANTLGITPGAYKLVVTLTHVNPNPTGVAGYEEGTIVQFVDQP
ncbi:MAG: hypothetical protein JNK38_26995 [Acidobacteria bacterium]|nr:hypothetical protein [Acidobacteriota bacterium]